MKIQVKNVDMDKICAFKHNKEDTNEAHYVHMSLEQKEQKIFWNMDKFMNIKNRKLFIYYVF